MTLAQRERQALVQAMSEVGPDAPTLCGAWTVRDLAAHLIVRERRPDAAPGILLKPFAPHLESVQRKVAQRPFADLLDEVRSGPPFFLRPVDSLMNTTEMFVHHEDVRRGVPGWKPRTLSAADENQLWKLLTRLARMAYRASPVTVALSTPDGRRTVARRAGERTVVLAGPPSELLLHAFGRNAVELEATGAPEDVALVHALDRSI
ncbi:TIGR03085 family metal-binding protein [Nocardia aurantiaca]|uniref:TIGR03085 family protein n=1 Tax=Nocardia aurantiaca TaxID=2675850 RepID=A0A6I3KX59_9NOCA|nr:TIGR03085 family metal-binding protein [Nocardia aurantiaca]MTE13458.1 TIGR03085 family protein [Nocardia aurantiaca]